MNDKELDMEHRECPAFDIMAAAGMEEEDVNLLTKVEVENKEGGGQEGDKRYIVDLWPFTRPVQFYRKLLVEVMMTTGSSTAVAMTSTAHPSFWLAGRQEGMSVFALLKKASNLHSVS